MVWVPYFASIVPHVVRMEPGLAEVMVPKWFFVLKVDVRHLWPLRRGFSVRDGHLRLRLRLLQLTPHPSDALRVTG